MAKSFLNWSGGKDCSYALYKLQQKGEKIDLLFTTVNAKTKRVSMHGTPLNLLKEQAKCIGIPLKILEIPNECSMKFYDKLMRDCLKELRENNYQKAYFGDIFLEDLKQYRIEKYKNTGITPYFPLWNLDTKKLIEDFVKQQFKAIIVSVKSTFFNKENCGVVINSEFINQLPESVDYCGENGEFHSFVFNGPIFKKLLSVSVSDIKFHEYKLDTKETIGFWFADLQQGKKT